MLQESLPFFLSLSQLKSALSAPPSSREGISVVTGTPTLGSVQRKAHFARATGRPPAAQAVGLAGSCWAACCRPIGPSSCPQGSRLQARLCPPYRGPAFPGAPVAALGVPLLPQLLSGSRVWALISEGLSDRHLFTPSLEISPPLLSHHLILSFLSVTSHIISVEGLSFHERQKKPLTSSFLLCKIPECLKWEDGKMPRVNYSVNYYPLLF